MKPVDSKRLSPLRRPWRRIVSWGGGLLFLLSVASTPWAARANDDLSGTYVLFQQTASVTKLPVVKDVEARTRSISIHRLAHADGRLHGAGRLCDVRVISNTNMVVTTLPPAFKRLVSHVPFDAKLTEDETGLELSQDSPTLILGARLEHPLRDPLPDDGKDPRVYDQDKDGKPGVTVKVSGLISGEVYVVQRSKSLLSGRQKGSAFRGSIDFTNEQKVIGASSRMLHRDPKAEPIAESSYFVLQRVADDVDCDEANRLASTYPK